MTSLILSLLLSQAPVQTPDRCKRRDRDNLEMVREEIYMQKMALQSMEQKHVSKEVYKPAAEFYVRLLDMETNLVWYILSGCRGNHAPTR